MKGFRFRRRHADTSSTANTSINIDLTDADVDMDSVTTTLNIAGTEYAQKRREIFKLVKDLRALGGGVDIDIPRIAVIGGQSAGKSSLVEALTGISVPRDSGTCTRCPMECTVLTNEDVWSCEISLGRAGKQHEQFSPKLMAKKEVEIWLRRAQAAILNPHLPPNHFKGMGYENLRSHATTDQQTLKFSKDAVVINIEDPEGTDLSFVDLPGLVQNEDDAVISLVKSLVEGYISEQSTLILVTIPASGMSSPVLSAQTESSGVITKPDSLTSGATGARQKWLDVIQGRFHKLEHGYYVVRLPDDEERAKNLSRQDLERLATTFFQTTEPWKELLSCNRVGIPNLVSYISKVLMKVIEESLPYLKEQVREKLSKCLVEIQGLPKAVSIDSSTEVFTRISRFCKDLQGDVEAVNESKKFVHLNKKTYKAFKLNIRSTYPDFRPVTKIKEEDIIIDPQFVKDTLDNDVESRSPKSTLPPMTLLDVGRVIEDCSGWELPHHIPYEAIKVLIKRSVDLWPQPSQRCFDGVLGDLSAIVNEKITKHFGQFLALEKYIAPMIRNELGESTQRARQVLADVLEGETVPYFTQNNHYFETVRSNCLEHYRDVYRNPHRYRSQKAREEPVAYSPSVFSRTYEARILESKPEAPLEPLPYESERVVMATVRAYFQVAYKRVIDNVPLTIQRHLNQRFVNGLETKLVEKLDLGAANTSRRLAELLEEDPTLKAKRKRLADEKRQLEEMQTKLNNFQWTPSSRSLPLFPPKRPQRRPKCQATTTPPTPTTGAAPLHELNVISWLSALTFTHSFAPTSTFTPLVDPQEGIRR
ncbi:uncharacterized protein FIBRA_00363 [Fibroporia radiculosa]|uniref:GED domain-containing protein n=1 Tax=Fibroporia radiculosa TaxID=599839 RepID=J7SCS1_9APHY|nr:uncharacterized protein FIBRA_00363 [Fibroporia radiculosa]CCL98368.1 predicted protein [Fibroporia radiculosa]